MGVPRGWLGLRPVELLRQWLGLLMVGPLWFGIGLPKLGLCGLGLFRGIIRALLDPWAMAIPWIVWLPMLGLWLQRVGLPLLLLDLVASNDPQVRGL